MKQIYNAAHTPGPWRVCPSPVTCVGSPSWEIADDIDKTIAWVQEPQPRSRAEMEANAILLASAPELLAACRACLRLLENPDAEPADADHATAILRAAIAKAEGGAA